MKKQFIHVALAAFLFAFPAFFATDSARAQLPLQMVTEYAHRHSDFDAGIHSGSWTLKREQILEAESKDQYRSCRDPYCLRCSKHLADYGHEYQYIGGPSQRQLWYRGTAGSIAPVTQRCYDEHGMPYAHRGRPGAVMAWEYQRYLNHAIWEQVRARNAVAAEEAAEDRVAMLSELKAVALGLLETSEGKWNWIKESGSCTGRNGSVSPCRPNRNTTVAKSGTAHSAAGPTLCEYCTAKAQYEKDLAYVAEVEKELALAIGNWQALKCAADEAVRIALLSKDDADRATRFKRIQHKPPKYKEVLAAREAAGLGPKDEQKSEENAPKKEDDAKKTTYRTNTSR